MFGKSRFACVKEIISYMYVYMIFSHIDKPQFPRKHIEDFLVQGRKRRAVSRVAFGLAGPPCFYQFISSHFIA